MKLMYEPCIGDRVLIKKTKLTGTVIKGGINCIVDIDGIPIASTGLSTQRLLIRYTRLAPVDPGAITRRTIRKKFKAFMDKLNRFNIYFTW